MIKQIGVLFVLICLIVYSFPLKAQEEWELARKDDDIKVYLHSSWKETGTYRAEAIVNAPVKILYDFITDFDNYINWAYCCDNIEVLLEEKDKKYAYYAYYDIPWPFADRDVVSVLDIIHHPNGIIEVNTSPGTGYKPLVPDAIRITKLSEHYLYIPVSQNCTRIEMTGSYDPGGTVPDWLIKQFLTMGPLDALQEIKKNSEERAKKQ